MQLLLEYHSDPYQENDQGQSPIDVCKHPEILRLLREADASRDEGAREESEEEDVFIPKEKQVARVKSSRVKSGGSKGSSQSSGESLFEEEEDFARDKTKEPMFVEGASSGLTSEEAEREKSIGQTPNLGHAVPCTVICPRLRVRVSIWSPLLQREGNLGFVKFGITWRGQAEALGEA